MKCSRITKKGTGCKNPVASGSGTWLAEDGWTYYDCRAHRGSDAPVRLHNTNVGHAPVQPTLDLGTPPVVEHPVARIMVTGHRTVNEPVVVKTLEFLLKGYAENIDTTVISGGAQGADRLWALAAHHLDVPFEVYVPRGYGENYFKGERLARFNRMLDLSSAVHYTQHEGVAFHYSMNFKRNVDMVKTSTHFIIVAKVHPLKLIKEQRGGTRHAVLAMIEAGVDDAIWVNSQTGAFETVHLQNK